MSLTQKDDDEPGGMMAANPHFERDFAIDTIWQNAVGVCIAADCGRAFISRERFDAIIAPLLLQLATITTTLRERDEQLEKLTANREYWRLACIEAQEDRDQACRHVVDLEQQLATVTVERAEFAGRICEQQAELSRADDRLAQVTAELRETEEQLVQLTEFPQLVEYAREVQKLRDKLVQE